MKLKASVLTVGYKYFICISVKINYSSDFYDVIFHQYNSELGPLYSNNIDSEIESVRKWSYRSVLQGIFISPDELQNGKILTKKRLLGAIMHKDFIMSRIAKNIDDEIINQHFMLYKKTGIKTFYLDIDPSDIFSKGSCRTEFARVVQEFYHNTVQMDWEVVNNYFFYFSS